MLDATSLNAPDEEAVVLWEIGRGDNGVVRLSRGVHLRENLLGQSLQAGKPNVGKLNGMCMNIPLEPGRW